MINIDEINKHMSSRGYVLVAVSIISKTESVVLVETRVTASVQPFVVWSYYHHQGEDACTTCGDYASDLNEAHELFRKREETHCMLLKKLGGS